MDKETLTQWVRELQSTQERTERQLAHVRALLDDLSDDGPRLTVMGGPTITIRRRSPTQNDVAADTTNSILKRLGKPTSRQVLYDMVVAQGLTFGGQNPINTYGAILSRDNRFESIPGMRGMWGLSEWAQKGTAPVEESRPSLSSDGAVPESVDGATLEVVEPPGPSGFEPPLRHPEG